MSEGAMVTLPSACSKYASVPSGRPSPTSVHPERPSGRQERPSVPFLKRPSVLKSVRPSPF